MEPDALVLDAKITRDLDILDDNLFLGMAWNPRSCNGKGKNDQEKRSCGTENNRLHRGT
jgi:hypothetical protein